MRKLSWARATAVLLLSALTISGCGVGPGPVPVTINLSPGTSTPPPTILNDGAQVRTAHCRVTNEGFDVNYATAFANVCEMAYQGYYDIFDLDILALINADTIEIRLVRQDAQHIREYLAGKVITFRGKETHFLPPSEGGANNIYAVILDMGYLAFPLDDLYYRAAWADYAASYRIIPYVWDRLGATAWPHPYNYLANDGPADIQRRITEAESGGDTFTLQTARAAAVFIAVDNAYGSQTIGHAIRQMKVPLTLKGFQEALVKVSGDEGVLKLFIKETGLR